MRMQHHGSIHLYLSHPLSTQAWVRCPNHAAMEAVLGIKTDGA